MFLESCIEGGDLYTRNDNESSWPSLNKGGPVIRSAQNPHLRTPRSLNKGGPVIKGGPLIRNRPDLFSLDLHRNHNVYEVIFDSF